METGSDRAAAAPRRLDVRSDTSAKRRGRPAGVTRQAIEERQRLAARLYADEGLSLQDTADELGVSKRQVQKDLDAIGVARRQPDREAIESRRQETRRLYEEEGLTLAEISARNGCSQQTFFRDLRALGVRRRPPGRRNPFPGSIEERRCAVLAEVLSSGSTLAAARRLGLGQSLVYHDYLRAGGEVSLPRPRRSPEVRDGERAIVLALYRDHHYTLKELAGKTGHSETTALRDLEAQGQDRRCPAHLVWRTDRTRALKWIWRATYERTGSRAIYGRNNKKLAEAKDKTVGRPRTWEPWAGEIAELERQGKSQQAIADRLGISRGSVRHALAAQKSAGLNPQPRRA